MNPLLISQQILLCFLHSFYIPPSKAIFARRAVFIASSVIFSSTSLCPSTILLFLLIVSNIYAQRANEFKELFHEAEFAFFSEENYERAIPIFLMLSEMEPDNANVKYYIASCYLHMMGQKSKAIPYLEEAIQKATEKYVYGCGTHMDYLGLVGAEVLAKLRDVGGNLI